MTQEQIDLIITKTKGILGLQSDIQLSRWLKKADNYIATWRKRNTIDIPLLMDSLPNADYNFLFKSDITSSQYQVVTKSDNQHCQECKSKDAVIASLERQIDRITDKLGQARPTASKDSKTGTRDSEAKKDKTHSGFH